MDELTARQKIAEAEDGVDVLVAQIRKRDDCLHMARYAFHKAAAARYYEKMAAGMSLEHAREMYRLAMANYDGLLNVAATGYAQRDANNIDMHKGFPYPAQAAPGGDDGG
jgi:L-asparaginase II